MLSVAMIAKNEVKTIRQTVESVKDYVDEVVIGLDVTSDDGTKEVAEEVADKIVPIYLSEELASKTPRKKSRDKNDWGFSRARNDVLDACDKKNWRLILDGHELVHNPEKLEDIIKGATDNGCDGIEIPLKFEPDQNGIPRLQYNQARLLAPAVIYVNPIHNVPVIRRTHTTDEIFIEHRKKDQDVTSKKDRDVQRTDSSINGLKKKVKDNPNDARSWFYLGNAYKENALWHDAIEAYDKQLEFDKWNEQRWHGRVNMGICYRSLGEEDKAREQFTLALEEFPAMAEAYYYLGDLAYKQKRYREAQVWLEKCVELDTPKCKLFVNPKIYLVDRYDLLSMTYHHLKYFKKAIEQAEKAYDAVQDPRIKKNIDIWEDWIEKHGSIG